MEYPFLPLLIFQAAAQVLKVRVKIPASEFVAVAVGVPGAGSAT